MSKTLMPYGSAANADLVSKVATVDTGKFVELVENLQKKDRDAPEPDKSTK